MNLKKQTVNGIKWQVGVSFLQKVISFVTTIILARILGPSNFGLFALALVIVGAFGLFKSMGIESALIQRKDNIKLAADTAFYIIPVLGILLYLFLNFSAPIIGKLLDNKEIISVIGLGIMGLTTAVGFALKGHRVIGIDIDPEKVKQINQRVCPMYEEELCKTIRKVEITATTDHRQALTSDVSFLCGGTPPKEDGSLDLFYLEEPAKQLAEVQQRLAADYPNISVINIASTIKVLAKIMHKLATIIQFFTFFTLLAGLLIIVSSIYTTRLARVREAVYFKVLGAKQPTQFLCRVGLYLGTGLSVPVCKHFTVTKTITQNDRPRLE